MKVESDVSELAPCPFSHAHIRCEISLHNYSYRGFDLDCIGVVECTCGARIEVFEFISPSEEDNELEVERVMDIALRKAAEAWNRRAPSA